MLTQERGGYSDAQRVRGLASSSDWAVIPAGGDGTRLQSLTLEIEGDSRPKQFSRIYGGRSLLAHTRERLRPVFQDCK